MDKSKNIRGESEIPSSSRENVGFDAVLPPDQQGSILHNSDDVNSRCRQITEGKPCKSDDSSRFSPRGVYIHYPLESSNYMEKRVMETTEKQKRRKEKDRERKNGRIDSRTYSNVTYPILWPFYAFDTRGPISFNPSEQSVLIPLNKTPIVFNEFEISETDSRQEFVTQ